MVRVKFQSEMAKVRLIYAKLHFEVHYLRNSTKQQEKELEVDHFDIKEYLKYCNSLFKKNTNAQASWEKFNSR